MEAYFDMSATTPVCPQAVQAVNDCLTSCYGNPSSLHIKGMEAQEAVTAARKTLAKALACDAKEILFASSATECNNLALRGLVQAYPRKGKRIVASAVEHPSVARVLEELEKDGYDVIRIPPRKDARFYPEDFSRAVTADTVLVSCMLVNNETGVILPVGDIARASREVKADLFVHCDAVQGLFKTPFTVRTLGADLVTVSGHKVYAPKGVGALYVRKGVRLHPQTIGGGQENGIRSGTEPVPLIAAFGAAVQHGMDNREEDLAAVREVSDYLRNGLAQLPGVALHFPQEITVPHIISVSVQGVRSEIMLHHLESQGVYVSSGSACSKGAQSTVLRTWGLADATADQTLRISMGYTNTLQQAQALLDGVRSGIERIRR